MGTESREAIEVLNREFSLLDEVLESKKQALIDGRKTKKLTKIEETTFAEIASGIYDARKRIEKEVTDVELLLHKRK